MQAPTAIPVLIVVLLGLSSGCFWHRTRLHFWLASAAAALTAGAAWAVGCWLFLLLLAPSEARMGATDAPIAVTAFLVTSVVALFPALVTGLVVRRKTKPRQNTH